MGFEQITEDYASILSGIVSLLIAFIGGFVIGHYKGQISRVNKLTNNYIDELEKENESLKNGGE